MRSAAVGGFSHAGEASTLPHGEALVELAGRLRASGSAVREGGAAVLAAWRPIAMHYQAPEAAELFVSMNPVEQVTDEHADWVGRLAQVVAAFADDVMRLEGMQTALARELAGFADDSLAADERLGDWRDDPELASRSRALDAATRAIESGLYDAEDRALAQLSALALEGYRIPTTDATASLFPSGPAPWTTVLPAFDAGLESTALGFLASLVRKRDLASWAATHQAELRGLLESEPDSTLVREWWQSLDRSSRDALIAKVPLLVGNLNGIVLADRAAANRLIVRAAIGDLEKKNEALRTLAPTYDSSYRLVSGAEANARAIAENEKTIRSFSQLLAESDLSRDGELQIVAFDLKRESFVAYTGRFDSSTGELPPSTTRIGVIVPGTGTNPATWENEGLRARNVLAATAESRDIGIFSWAGGHFPQGLDAASAAESQNLGPKLAGFVNAVRPTTSATISGVGYSYGGAVLGIAEKTGMAIDRSLHVSSAGLGHGVWSTDDYPFSARAPHYSMMAPDDRIVGFTQGLQSGDLGHGGSPLDHSTGFERLETGYNDATRGVSSGQLKGHLDVWRADTTVVEQVGRVISGGDVELYAQPTVVGTTPAGAPIYSNPVMERDYSPVLERVQGDHE